MASVEASSPPASIASQALTLGFYVVAPIGVYYALRAAGVSNLTALSIGAVAPGLGAAVQIARARRVDRLALAVMSTMLASAGFSFVTGSTRFVLAKDGWITGLWGLWFLLSARGRRPAAFLFSRPLLEGRKAFTSESWDSLWDRVPAFRRTWSVSTVMWGVGLILDAGARVVMAYTVPVALVPAIGGALYPATFVALQVITNVYYHRSGLWTVLEAPWVRVPRRAWP